MITVWTPVKRTDATVYLLGIIPKLVEIYENYFGSEYPCHHLEYYSVPNIVPYMPAKYGIVITS